MTVWRNRSTEYDGDGSIVVLATEILAIDVSLIAPLNRRLSLTIHSRRSFQWSSTTRGVPLSKKQPNVPSSKDVNSSSGQIMKVSKIVSKAYKTACASTCGQSK